MNSVLVHLNKFFPILSSAILRGVSWFKTDVSGPIGNPETSVITQKTEEFNSTMAEAYDYANSFQLNAGVDLIQNLFLLS
jgi:hypothetical protein